MKRAGGIALVVLLLAGAFTLGLRHTRAPERAPAAIPDASRPHPGLVDEIRHELLTHYYRPVPARVLRQKTVDAMLKALNDRYTDYLSAVEYDALKDRTAKSYSGIGLTVEPSKQGLVVRAALDGPAREAGINRGDVIVAIDGRPVRKLPFERSLMLIEGKEGTSVRLTVIGPRGGRKVVTVVREEIAVSATRARLLSAGKAKLGYVRLLSFPAGAAESVKRRIASLVRRGAEGVILDLRNNPGGLLSQAILTVSLFEDEGVVCTTDGLHQKRRVYEVEGNPAYPRLPLVVLVNRGSASAAEIVAAALRDNRRAVVVGQRTYGKAAVQTIRELANGEALKITTAVFLTPAGTNLMRHGVRPTVRAVDNRRTRRDEALRAAQATLLDKIR